MAKLTASRILLHAENDLYDWLQGFLRLLLIPYLDTLLNLDVFDLIPRHGKLACLSKSVTSIQD